jgi:hypothetical protein
MHESAQSSIIFCCSNEASSIAGEMFERFLLGGVKSACLGRRRLGHEFEEEGG